MTPPETSDCNRDAEASFAPAPGYAPTWYTENELRYYLSRNHYAKEIEDELAKNYAFNLQKAFEKGYEIGRREAHNVRTEQRRDH